MEPSYLFVALVITIFDELPRPLFVLKRDELIVRLPELLCVYVHNGELVVPAGAGVHGPDIAVFLWFGLPEIDRWCVTDVNFIEIAEFMLRLYLIKFLSFL